MRICRTSSRDVRVDGEQACHILASSAQWIHYCISHVCCYPQLYIEHIGSRSHEKFLLKLYCSSAHLCFSPSPHLLSSPPLFSTSLLLFPSSSLWVFTLRLHLAAPWPCTDLLEKAADGESRPLPFSLTHTHILSSLFISFSLFLSPVWILVSHAPFGLVLSGCALSTDWRISAPLTHHLAQILQVEWNGTCVCVYAWMTKFVLWLYVQMHCMCVWCQVVCDCVFTECLSV